jgi:hypothetical protein
MLTGTRSEPTAQARLSSILAAHSISQLSLTHANFPPGAITGLENSIRKAFEQHGLEAFAAPKEAAVAHEVGHAIVGTHEGLTIRQVKISSRSTPGLGLVWCGRCLEVGGEWTSGPDSSAEDDLHRARYIIAGLAAETICKFNKPGSSLNELMFSQVIGINAAAKLADYARLKDDAEYTEYAKQLWYEQVWRPTGAILFANREAFDLLYAHLHQSGTVKGAALRKALAKVKRITP